jgi:hypothetical protein
MAAVTKNRNKWDDEQDTTTVINLLIQSIAHKNKFTHFK